MAQTVPSLAAVGLQLGGSGGLVDTHEMSAKGDFGGLNIHVIHAFCPSPCSISFTREISNPQSHSQ